MSYNGQWDVIVAFDESVANRLANDYWQTAKVKQALSEWRAINRSLPLPPTPYRLDISATVDFIELSPRQWLNIKLLAESSKSFFAEVSFSLQCEASCHVVTALNEADSALAGTLLDIKVGASATVSAKSALVDMGTDTERLVLSFENLEILTFGLIGDDNLPQGARDAIEALLKPKIHEIFAKIDPPSLSPLRRKLVDATHSGQFGTPHGRIDSTLLDLRVVSFPANDPAHPYRTIEDAKSDPKRNTAIIVSAAFVMASPHPNLPNPTPVPLEHLPMPISAGQPGTVTLSQRVLSYLTAFFLPWEARRQWARGLGVDPDKGPNEEGLYRFMFHPDTFKKTIPVDNSDDETISIDQIRCITIVESRLEIEFALHVCKSGFLFGAPDPNYGVVIGTTYGANDDGDKLVTKGTEIVGFWNEDGWFERAVAGTIGALFDLTQGMIALLKWDFREAWISSAWGLGQTLGMFFYELISIAVWIFEPDIDGTDLVKEPFKIPWDDNVSSKIGYVGEAKFFNASASRDPDPWASMQIAFTIL